MTKHRALGTLTALLLMALAAPVWAQQPPQPPTPPASQKAGSITALLPTAHVIRGTGKQAADLGAKKGDNLYWNDTLKTDKGGRARVTLVDQSILSLGSQAELKIVRHDARTQQTALQLQYGRLRAEVTSITRAGGSFEVRTPTAVAGVIGTDFGTDSGVGDTTFLCISGSVSVANSDNKVPGSVQCTPGQTTTVGTGKAPTPPKPASAEQIQQLIQDTTPANIGSLSPASALVGATLNITINGTKLTGIQNPVVSGTGITASMVPGGTDTQATVHLVIAPNAQPGARTLTLSKAAGAQSAAVFTILSPPSVTTGTDPRKAYHDLLTQEQGAAKAGLSGVLATVQQAADQAEQAVTQANSGLPQPLDLSQANNGFSGQVAAVKAAIDAAGAQDDQAETTASNGFDAAAQTAQNALLQRNPAGTPDATYLAALKSAFDLVNGQMQTAFDGNQKNLNTLVQTADASIGQLAQTWLQQLATAAQLQQAGPAVAVNGSDRPIDVGAAFGQGGIASLDASRTKPTGNTTILGYSWVLCDASYKPQLAGVPIPANTAGCNPLPGYVSSTADFGFPTCNLAPADYIARVVATDSNNKKTAMDVRVHVLPPTYDDPKARILNLANAYVGLQPTQFMGFFDDQNYPGYTVLSENIRNTFPTLNTMTINVIVSQSSIICNEADLRANWDQNYTFKSNPAIPVEQREQLTMRMVRVPGKNWYITDFSGDNGTVQGIPPGPIVTDAPAVNLTVTSLSITNGAFVNKSPGATRVNSTARRKDVLVPPGSVEFSASVANIGRLDAPASTIHIGVQDSSGNEIAGGNFPIPALTAAGTSNSAFGVNGSFPISNTAGVALSLVATVNPGCGSSASNINEGTCNDNTAVQPFATGVPFAKYVITNFTFQGHNAPFTGANGLQVGETNLVGIATVANVGDLTQSGTMTLTAVCTPAPPCDPNPSKGAVQTVPVPAANTSTQVFFNFNNFNMTPGTYTGTATLTTSLPQGDTTGNTLQITFEGVDFQLTAGPSFSPNAQNIMIGSSVAQITSTITETGNVTQFPVPISVDPINAGTFAIIPNPFQSPGTQNITINSGFSTPPGAGTITVRGTNHGVSKTVALPVNFYSAQIVANTLLVNDPADPLVLNIGSASPFDIALKMAGTSYQSTAALVPPATVGALTSNVNPTIAASGDTFDLLLTAGAGSTSVVTPLALKAQIPFTNPQDMVTYTVFVLPKSIPDLNITVAPPAGFSAPAVNGQGLDFQVTVANSATAGNSAGGETVKMWMNQAQTGLLCGQGTVPIPLAPGQNIAFTVHCVIPDTQPTSANTTVAASVIPGAEGDLNFADNTTTLNLATSDWCLIVSISPGAPCVANGPGSSDGTPLTIVLAGNNTTTLQAQVIGGGAASPTVTLVPGVFSTGMQAPLIVSSPIAVNNGTSTVQATVSNPNLAVGIYLVQVMAQMTDGATVTARRQATVHVMESATNPTDTVTINSVPTNPAGPANTTAANAVQINGALPVQLAIAATRAGCSVGPCPGSVDIAFSDTNATQTTPLQLKALPYGVQQSITVTPNQDASGNLVAGPAIVTATATAVQTSAVRTPGPDPNTGQPQQLFFNVGDITVTGGQCVGLAPGAAAFPLSVTFVPSGGFNTVVSWAWQPAVGASGVSFSPPSGSVLVSNTPSPFSVQVSNITTGIDGLQVFNLVATVSNSLGTASKTFSIAFDLSNAQNFCGAPYANRTIRGSWSRGGGQVLPNSVATPRVSAAMADLQISASDVSFTPSVPKEGDTIQVRFRVVNAGTANASQVPIVLQVDGATVASNTFDVAAGKSTLGGLQWTSAKSANSPARTFGSRRGAVGDVGVAPAVGRAPLNASLVIDPQHLTAQKSNIGKSVPLTHLSLQSAGASTLVSAATASSQRLLLSLDEGACIGVRLASGGAGPCSSADIEITAADVGKGTFTLVSSGGISDAGFSVAGVVPSAARLTQASFSSQVSAQAGHVYAVQLSGGKIGYVTIESIRNPSQLDARTRALFRKTAIRAVQFGESSGPADPGDVSGSGGSKATVYIQLVLQGQ